MVVLIIGSIRFYGHSFLVVAAQANDDDATGSIDTVCTRGPYAALSCGFEYFHQAPHSNANNNSKGSNIELLINVYWIHLFVYDHHRYAYSW